MMVTFFYSRISTSNQNSSRQLVQFRKSNEFDSKNVYVDKIQGNERSILRETRSC